MSKFFFKNLGFNGKVGYRVTVKRSSTVQYTRLEKTGLSNIYGYLIYNPLAKLSTQLTHSVHTLEAFPPSAITIRKFKRLIKVNVNRSTLRYT